jgi:HAD superfamily hydrolase (TIGR01549 family)
MNISNSSRAFDAIIFDLGGTLIFFDGEWPEILRQADQALFTSLESAGLRLDRERFLGHFRDKMEIYYRERDTEFIEHTTLYILREILKEWGNDELPEAVLRSALKAMYSVTQAYWMTELDSHAVLQDLSNQGYRLGMISNAGDDADVQVLVDKANLRGYFDFILTSAALGIRKPNPRIFEIGLERWKLPAGRVAMVGDTLGADILGAQLSGLTGIWITRRADTPANRAHSHTILPDAEISSLSELPELLMNYPGK